MCGEALLDHPLVPVRYRELRGSGHDTVPQRLHVVDLLVD
jgi:hypothetical protein